MDFSWLMKGRVGGCGRPQSPDALRELRAEGVGALISLTEDPLPADWLTAADLHAVHIPVPDFTAPTQAQIVAAMAAVDHFAAEGRAVLFHCAGGKGRTGTMLACVLVRAGQSAADAIAAVRIARPHSVETSEQEAAIAQYAASL